MQLDTQNIQLLFRAFIFFLVALQKTVWPREHHIITDFSIQRYNSATIITACITVNHSEHSPILPIAKSFFREKKKFFFSVRGEAEGGAIQENLL